MAVINYQNLPSTSTPLNATNLNSMQVIAETVTNANGTAIKFTDGTMICTNDVSYSGTRTIEKGSGGYRTTQIQINFPVSFIDTPCVSLDDMSGYAVSNGTILHSKANGFFTMAWWGIVSYSSDLNYSANYIAIGRWKA